MIQRSARRAGVSFLVMAALLAAVMSVRSVHKVIFAWTPLAAANGQASGGGVEAATAGTLRGKVVLQGSVPRNEAIKMNADPVCVKETQGQQQTQETYTVGVGNGLQNAFVYIKDGLGRYTYDVPKTPVVIDQKQCRYHPHVFGIRVGQPLDILNSDPTLHNIHAMPYENLEFNLGQPVQGMRTTKTFTVPEVMVPIRCDVHGWMNAYVGVMDSPYFAVSRADGAFEIATLPPGTYTLAAWHEKLGTSTQKVTLGAKESREITVVFKVT